MKILWIRLSSLGDVVHTLPAMTDLAKLGFVVDVLTEENFVCVLKQHHNIHAIKTVHLRMFKRSPIKLIRHFLAIRYLIKQNAYDAIIDAQGLWKSALLAWRCAPFVIGGDATSVRESGVYLFYRQTVSIDLSQNVIDRYRQLAARAAICLGISIQHVHTQRHATADFALPMPISTNNTPQKYTKKTILLLHGTSRFRHHKMWPVAQWQALTHQLHQNHMTVLVPWHGPENSLEHRFAKLLEKSGAIILPAMPLESLLSWLMGNTSSLLNLQSAVGHSIANVEGVVSVDSGLGHLANALNLPGVMLFGPTSARRFSTAHHPWQVSQSVDFDCAPCGLRTCQRNVESGEKIPPCWSTLSANDVYQALMQTMLKKSTSSLIR